MKKIVYQNQSGIDSFLKKVNDIKASVTILLDEFNKLDLFKLTSIDDLSHLISKKESFLMERIEEELPIQKLGNFRINKKEAVALLDLPSFTVVIDCCNNCKEFSSYSRLFNYDGLKLEVDEIRLQLHTDAYRFYSTTKDQENLAAAHEAAVKALDQFQKALIASGAPTMSNNISIGTYFAVSDNTIKEMEGFYISNFSAT